ncbi:Inositol hexakisphosphate and diphosphoinositol-pentakisphosphate kinase 1 [Liparis tanakae]|uniref:Inositol hexakisphosphate and diphosphoinositol-pentakisphosphate kinase 1 n=1 Tax=Liparis tanakae TaxID=230148 RepID=A0A4Z2EW11_9TELE|nr:Inositol hexakisphosphate and diphosphoinositol-pentakisphosphate kinase 1 [Liparis tanakae]
MLRLLQQTVCGFDLLRASGHSYVCDVNGFSFVKNSMKYYDDCAKILGNIVMRELAPQFQIPWSIPTEAEDIPIVPTTSGTIPASRLHRDSVLLRMELRCVIAVIRHGDRTPKQKMKMEEYGINRVEKLDIAYAHCLPLVRKIQLDMQRTHEDESVNKLHPLYSRGVMSPGRHVRTRLYFTSESHVHSLLSIFRYGGMLDEENDEQWRRAMDYLSAVSELNYMTQIVIMLYEDNTKDITSEERFHVELHFSPGVKGVEEEENAPTGFGFRPASAEVARQKQTDPGSLEDLTRDETDRAVLSETSSQKVGSYRLFSLCSRQSPDMKQSGLGTCRRAPPPISHWPPDSGARSLV